MDKIQKSKFKNQNYKRILVIRLDKIGDVVLSTPVIKALRDAYPDSYIAFMVRPYAKQVVKGNPYLDRALVYDKYRDEKGIIGNWKFISELRKRRFDIAIILHPTKRSHIVPFLAGIPERVGYDRKLGFLLTKKVPHTKQMGLKHEIDYTLDMLRYIGVEPKDRTLHMPINDMSDAKVRHIFEVNGIGENDTTVVINPGASCPSKRWPPENFAKVADRLMEKYGTKVILISSGEEKMIGADVAHSMKVHPVNLCGVTTVGDLASILKRSKLLISNDSGPVHIACALGTPVVAIFGRNEAGLSPARWGPTGKDDIVLHKDVGCKVCLAHKCRIGFKCLNAITVEEVLEAADRILGKK